MRRQRNPSVRATDAVASLQMSDVPGMSTFDAVLACATRGAQWTSVLELYSDLMQRGFPCPAGYENIHLPHPRTVVAAHATHAAPRESTYSATSQHTPEHASRRTYTHACTLSKLLLTSGMRGCPLWSASTWSPWMLTHVSLLCTAYRTSKQLIKLLCDKRQLSEAFTLFSRLVALPESQTFGGITVRHLLRFVSGNAACSDLCQTMPHAPLCVKQCHMLRFVQCMFMISNTACLH